MKQIVDCENDKLLISVDELEKLISEISNCCFPLIDFFNDIKYNYNPKFIKEKAYLDIAKIYQLFMEYKKEAEESINLRNFNYFCKYVMNYVMNKEVK